MFKWILTFTNEENIDQPMTNQFSEIAQSYVSWIFNREAYIGGRHKNYKFRVDFLIFIFVVMCLNCFKMFYFFYQTTSKSVTVNHIQSFSIKIPRTVMCTFVLLKWICGIHKKHSLLHFSTVTVIQTDAIVYIKQYYSNRVLCYIDNMTKHCLVCEQWHKDIRHARGFHPRCLVRVSIAWCWRGSLAGPRPKTGYWGRIIIFCCLLYCTVLYSTLNWGIKHLGSTTSNTYYSFL